MSVDVSPDGTTLVFDLLGDIYTVPVAGGKATRHHARAGVRLPSALFARREDDRVHDRPQRDRQPLADGRRREESARADDGEGRVRPLRDVDAGRQLPRRPERRTASAAGIPPVELWMYHRHGGSGVKLTSSDEMNNASGPVVSPDGRYIYFSARQGALQLRAGHLARSLADLPLRPADRGHDSADLGLRRRGAAGDLA